MSIVIRFTKCDLVNVVSSSCVIEKNGLGIIFRQLDPEYWGGFINKKNAPNFDIKFINSFLEEFKHDAWQKIVQYCTPEVLEYILSENCLPENKYLKEIAIARLPLDQVKKHVILSTFEINSESSWDVIYSYRSKETSYSKEEFIREFKDYIKKFPELVMTIDEDGFYDILDFSKNIKRHPPRRRRRCKLEIVEGIEKALNTSIEDKLHTLSPLEVQFTCAMFNNQFRQE
jgi:hypothetical protein